MDIKEFREILTKHCQEVGGIEIHKNYFKVLCNFVTINDMITLNYISDIRIIKHEDDGDIDDKRTTVWFNRNHIKLEDIDTIMIAKVWSYL